MVKKNKYLILMQLMLLNLIGQNIIQCAARIQTEKIATEQDLELINAAAYGYSEKVEELIKQGANLNAVNYFDRTALMLAVRLGIEENKEKNEHVNKEEVTRGKCVIK